MKERLIVSTTTLIVSLTCYYYARHSGKDAVPYVMMAGFIGGTLGEAVTNIFSRREDSENEDEHE